MGQCQGNRKGVFESQGRRERKGCTRASFKEMSMACQKKNARCKRASIEGKGKAYQRVKDEDEQNEVQARKY